MISLLAEKYGLSEQQVRQLVNDGRFGCAMKKHEEIINEYNSSLSKGLPRTQAVANAAHVGRVSERQVYNILKEYKS